MTRAELIDILVQFGPECTVKVPSIQSTWRYNEELDRSEETFYASWSNLDRDSITQDKNGTIYIGEVDDE